MVLHQTVNLALKSVPAWRLASAREHQSCSQAHFVRIEAASPVASIKRISQAKCESTLWVRLPPPPPSSQNGGVAKRQRQQLKELQKANSFATRTRRNRCGIGKPGRSRRAHNSKTAGSNPAPATQLSLPDYRGSVPHHPIKVIQPQRFYSLPQGSTWDCSQAWVQLPNPAPGKRSHSCSNKRDQLSWIERLPEKQ